MATLYVVEIFERGWRPMVVAGEPVVCSTRREARADRDELQGANPDDRFRMQPYRREAK